MTFRDRLRRDRETLAGLDRRARLLFIWDYYKIPLLSALCVLVLGGLAIASAVTSGRAALYAVFVNTASPEGDPAVLDALLEEAGVDMTGRRVDVTADLHLGLEMDEAGDAQTIQVLAALFGISGLDVFAADEAAFARYADQDAFLDLSLFLERNLLDLYGDDLYRYETADGRQVLGGVILREGPLHDAGYFRGPVVVGAAANAQNMEEAVAFLRQLLLSAKVIK